MSTQDSRGNKLTLPTPTNPGATATQGSNQTNSTTTVTICCKFPNGFLMELGLRDDPDYVSIGLKGISHMRIAGAQWGVTEGVPKDFWDKWSASKKDFKFIKGGFIFAQSDAKEARAQAKAMDGLKTGLERLVPKNLPKTMKDVEKKVTELVED